MKTEVELVPIDSVLQDPDNARLHSADQLKYLSASLKRFSQQKPIVVGKDGVIIAGNGTHLAAKMLNWKDILIIRSKLSVEESRAYGIEVTCPFCSVQFLVAHHRFKHGRGKYCSTLCKDSYKKKQYKVEKECIICKKVFSGTIGKLAKRIYCSQTCFQKDESVGQKISHSLKNSEVFQSGQKERIVKHTILMRSEKYKENAKNKLILRLSNRESPEYKLWYKSIQERSKSEKWKNSPHFRKGKDNPKYKGLRSERMQEMGTYKYKTWRMSVFRRDNCRCLECDSTGKNLQAHHIKEWAAYPNNRYDIDNGKTLCQPCHIAHHKKLNYESKNTNSSNTSS